MNKLNIGLKQLLQGLRTFGSKDRKGGKSEPRHKRPIRFESLETRDLLSTLVWNGFDRFNNPDPVWSTDPAKSNWLDGVVPTHFTNGDIVKFNQYQTSKLNITISGNVKPSAMIFTTSDYNISGDSTGSISANATILTIQVNQQTITSDVIATISAPITNPTGGITQLVVDATGSDPDSGIDNDGNYYPTGTLILKGTNTYGVDDDSKNSTLIMGYSYRKPSDNTLTYTGGVLVAGSPDALPKNDNDVFRHIKVESAGTLAVENDGTANGMTNKWTNDTIPTLFNSNPNFEGDETLRSNFGIWVDEGKSFDYTQTIPGNSGGSENLNENFVKLGVGTLTLSGDNRRESPHFGYPGTTSINKGTLITTKPEALPRYGVSGQVMVKNTIPIDPDPSNVSYKGYGNYDGKIVGVSYDGSKDPHSTLIVPVQGTDSGGNTSGQGWDGGDSSSLAALINNSLNIFEDNTNFGIQVAEGLEFDFSDHSFNVYDNRPSFEKLRYVGFVKTGSGLLDFGNCAGASNDLRTSFAGPVTIYEGTLRAVPGGQVFPVSPYISLCINNDALLDLNTFNSEGSGSTYVNVRELDGEPRAVITDNAPFNGVSTSYGLNLKCSSNKSESDYYGSFVQGLNGKYPSLYADFTYSDDPPTRYLHLYGSTIELGDYSSKGITDPVFLTEKYP